MSPKTNNLFLKVALGVVVVGLALAFLIPDLLRSRMTADPPPNAEGSWYIRAIHTSEVTYATNFQRIGYAPNLAVLGPVGAGECGPERACLLDGKLGCAEGVGEQWCVYAGYRFNVQSSSSKAPYKDYWVTATPLEANPKLKNYCSTDDVIVRVGSNSPLRVPYTREECLALPANRTGHAPD